jgi:hypothetical protein
MNPYPKPQAGSYRAIVVAALISAQRSPIAYLFEGKTLNFGVVATFTGNVKRLPELQNEIIALLEQYPQNDIACYYVHELKEGRVAVVSSDGAFVYDANDKDAVEFVNKQLEKEGREIIKPGELYFNS